jgi:energy-coupling factor transporter ATP-binding protein EcfA2
VGGDSRRPLRIIEGASGVLRPGRFTLVLAPPGSGKTTLLKALAGRLRRETKDLAVTGKILYNGQSFEQFAPERSASYISQVGGWWVSPCWLAGWLFLGTAGWLPVLMESALAAV